VPHVVPAALAGVAGHLVALPPRLPLPDVTLERRTELRRDTAAARSFAAQRSQLRRTGRLAPKSDKRQAEDPERERLRRLVWARDLGQCQARHLVPGVRCWGPMDVDAICPEGVRPGAHLVLENLHLLCRAHHDWKHANARLAVAVGLRRWSWE